MQAGHFDRRITLQRATVTTNDLGEEVPAWGALATVWASKEDVRDSERMAAAEVGATITTRFQVRWNAITAGLTERDRLLCEGRAYEITHTKEIARREGVEVTAVARAE